MSQQSYASATSREGRRRKGQLKWTVAAVAAGVVAVPAMAFGMGSTAAHAASRDGVCTKGEFCYYFNSNEKGSVSDFKHSKANLGASQPDCYEFRGPGSGKQVCVKNNAASVWNRTGHTVTVYYNSNYGGPSQRIAPVHKANLIPALKNNNASHEFGGHASPPPKSSGTVRDVIAAARSQIGKGYVYAWAGGGKYGPTRGTTSPSGHHDGDHIGYDCSGLMQYAFWQGAHIDVGGYSGAQQGNYQHIPLSQRRPGDMVFWGSSASSTTHVALYIGNNQIIESSVPRTHNSVHVAGLFSHPSEGLLPFVVRPVR